MDKNTHPVLANMFDNRYGEGYFEALTPEEFLERVDDMVVYRFEREAKLIAEYERSVSVRDSLLDAYRVRVDLFKKAMSDMSEYMKRTSPCLSVCLESAIDEPPRTSCGNPLCNTRKLFDLISSFLK